MSPHPTAQQAGCPNSPNYYWSMAQAAYSENNFHEMYMYLILYAIATLGE